jgi:hypothetical protein
MSPDQLRRITGRECAAFGLFCRENTPSKHLVFPMVPVFLKNPSLTGRNHGWVVGVGEQPLREPERDVRPTG